MLPKCLTERLNDAPDFTPARWRPAPRAADRAVWDALPAADRWLAAGNETLHTGAKIPPLPLSLWTDFAKTGNRTRYEKAYFARRKAITRLTMAECCGYSGLCLPLLADYVWAVCEESAWQLPAHNSYIRDTPQLPLPDVNRPVVDLFAAETGALLAMVHYLLGDELDAAYPGLKHRIAAEVERRLLKPYRTTHFWWMGDGAEPMCNWTAWCTQNVLVATALLHPGSTALLRQTVAQAAYSLDCFLKDYGADGCCSEGAQYYRHAALTLYNALELLCALAPGVFDTVWAEPKIKNIAEYIANMHVAGETYLNFADCSPLAGRRGAREYLFARRVGSAALTALAAADFAADTDPDRLTAPDDSEGINLFYAVQTAFAEEEIRAVAKANRRLPPPVPGNVWYESVGLLCCRAGVFAAGVKAGCNADSHNHNDTGSVTLYKNGCPVLIDVGVGSYTKKTFSPQRYEIWTMQSAYHNLPVFLGAAGENFDQLPGAEYKAANVAVDADLSGITMDLAPAYTAHGEVPGLRFYTRQARLAAGGLTLHDTTDYPGTVALTLMSAEAPTVTGDTVRFGALATARLQGADRVAVEAIPLNDPRLRTAWPARIYRTCVYFNHELTVIVE